MSLKDNGWASESFLSQVRSSFLSVWGGGVTGLGAQLGERGEGEEDIVAVEGVVVGRGEG